jgi:hypothetical protein
MVRAHRAIRVHAILAATTAAAFAAGVGDPQIATDHAQMQGELSCSTFERLEATAFAQFAKRYGHAPATAVERVIAHWAWRTEHHQHADGNSVYYGAGCKQALGGAENDGLGFNRDGLLGLFAHSTGLCYSIHAQFTPFIQKTLGNYLAASCTTVPGHTSFEAFADGHWRLADMTVGHMVFDKDPKQPMGILDIAANQSRSGELNGGFMKLKLCPFGDRLNTYDSVKEPEGEGKQKLFGFLGMPIVYALRSGETFTRWRLPDGGDGVEAIWSQDYNEKADGHPKHHGMARRETFMTFGAVGDGSIGRKGTKNPPLVYSAKGVFEYVPDLKTLDPRSEYGWSASANVACRDGKLVATGGEGQIVITHAAPYPVAAHQADNADAAWNVVKNPCDKTAIFGGTASAALKVLLSLDAGQTWIEVGTADRTFAVDFSDRVKGRFSYQLKVVLPVGGELSAPTLRTVVQVGPAVFPWLKDQGSTITYQASNLGVIHGGPDYRMAKAFRAAELDADGWQVYRITAPGAIRSLHGVSMVNGRKEMSVETSLDGKTWDVAMAPVTLGRASKELNGSIWGNGTLGFMWGDRSYPAGSATTGFIRFHNGDEAATQVYATYEIPGKPMGLAVTVNWSDAAGAGHEAGNTFKAGPEQQSWTVKTGTATVTNWVRFQPVEK